MPPLMKYSMLILINLSVNSPEISYTYIIVARYITHDSKTI